jgi:hypothetical protein
MATQYWISTSSTDPSLAANWSTGVALANGDDAYIQAIPGLVLANIGASNMSAVTLNSLTISQSFTGTVGAAGAGGYWQIGATTWTLGTITGGINPGGSGRIKLNFGSVQFTGTIISTAGSATDSGQEPVRILGTHASNKLSVLSGTAGVATNVPGEVSTLSEVDVVGNPATGSSPTCNLGSGVTWTTAYCAGGGTLTTNSGSSGALDCAGSTATCNGTALIATVTNSGTIFYNVTPPSGSCITTLNNLANGTVDFTGGPAARTVGTYKPYAGSSIRLNAANPAHVTFTTVSPQNLSTVTYA